jgi:RND family efflux transporter MFP subunit
VRGAVVRGAVVRGAVVRRAGLALALAAPLLLAGCFDDAAASDPEPDVPTVRLVTAGAASTIDSRRFVGRIEPLSVVDLAFQLPGEIVDLPVVQGTVVPQGGTIAALDPAAYELALTRARASLALAEAEYARARDLVERGAAPEARLDQTVADRALAAVGVDSAERDLRLTRIAAPFDALITRRLVDTHSYVTGGTAVVRVQDVTEMRVTISVPEDLVWLARSPESFTAGARLAALPEVVLPLRLREFVTEPDRVAQTYEVSFAIDAPRDPRVLPGMTATVEIRANGAGGGPGGGAARGGRSRRGGGLPGLGLRRRDRDGGAAARRARPARRDQRAGARRPRGGRARSSRPGWRSWWRASASARSSSERM